YSFQRPRFFGDLLYTFVIRSGLDSSALQPLDLYAIANRQEYASYPRARLADLVGATGGRLYLVGGVLSLIALGWWVARMRSNREWLLVGSSLASLCVLWFVVMSNHTYAHDFQMLLALPVASFCVGLLGRDTISALDTLVTGSRLRVLMIGIVVLGPLWLVTP